MNRESDPESQGLGNDHKLRAGRPHSLPSQSGCAISALFWSLPSYDCITRDQGTPRSFEARVMQGAGVSGWHFIWEISRLFRPNSQGSDPNRWMFQCFNMTQAPPRHTPTNQSTYETEHHISGHVSFISVLPDLLELEPKRKSTQPQPSGRRIHHRLLNNISTPQPHNNTPPQSPRSPTITNHAHRSDPLKAIFRVSHPRPCPPNTHSLTRTQTPSLARSTSHLPSPPDQPLSLTINPHPKTLAFSPSSLIPDPEPPHHKTIDNNK